MRILITGGLGFVGTQISIRLLEKGHHVTVVGHAAEPRPYSPREIRYVSADTALKGAWQEEVAGQDAVINLAGTSISVRWDDDTKQIIRSSRISTTRNVVEAMTQEKGALLCSASAVGYYGFRGDEELTEEDAPGDDFLARLCIDWENEAQKATNKGVRVVTTRFGIVLGKAGGPLEQMVSAFKKFVGGPLGTGNQWSSWIHMEDLLNAFMFIFENKEIHGPVNFCSPNPVRNTDLAKALGKVLSRPSFLRTPAFMLRLVLGEFGSVLLEGQKVIPAKLLKHGFIFRYPGIMDALEELTGKG
ncbi:MAG: TIGR01777 family protein [Desulfobacterales bacterium S3730MH5]|nr:MAG: TIGR01777 family protein [Desulfobacterales bacterium S3730MH5]